ncbi:MAG: helix-turn-helix domain-containing protein [Pseudomonadota bacterium]
MFTFIGSKIFERELPNYLNDDEYGQLQRFMMEHPEAGDIIPGSGGVRKLRWQIFIQNPNTTICRRILLKRPRRNLPMKLKGKALEEHESKRDIGQELLEAIDEIKSGGGKRYTVIPKTPAARARLNAGLSQAKFAELLGVSKRTLEQWEQGRREPSGAAKTLIKIAELHPESLKDIVAA